MSLSKLTEPFLLIFYIFAQNPFPSTINSKNKLKRILSKLPVLVLTCISLYVTLYSLKNDQYVTRKNQAREIIHVLSIISSLITNLTIAYQCIFLSQYWIDLQESLGRVEIEFQNLLPSVNVKLKKFRKNYLIKCIVILVLYFISIFTMVMCRVSVVKFVTSYMVVLALINDLNAFQLIFYVDLSNLFLKTITQAFRDAECGDLTKCSEEFSEAKFMLSMKKLHLCIWKTVDNINEYFGLFLLGYIVQQFLRISYDIYWIFLNKFNVDIWLSLDNAFVLACTMVSFFFVTNSCEKIYFESKKIGISLYNRDNYLMLSESQQFLSQILNQSIIITAKGFYKLNRSFFAALTVGSMTSAIMLVQFQTEN